MIIKYKIDFSPLKKAILSLEDILKQKMDVYRRDGAIQRFEYTFELTWKMMQRVLKAQGIEAGSPKQVFRSALKADIIENVEDWFLFLEKRNLTVHIYNEKVADEVFLAARKFPKYAKQVLQKLKKEVKIL